MFLRLRTVLICESVFVLATAACGGSSTSQQECEYDGQRYVAGETFPALDGCNTCSCESDGSIACTEIGCDSCAGVTSRYAEAMDQAKSCDPARAGQCSMQVIEGLVCGCQAFVNPEQDEAIEAAAAAQAQYQVLSCSGGGVCGPCLAPSSAYCSAAGRCEPVYDSGGGAAACKVSGIVYESGASGIPDPVSCNQCQCDDGQLICTEINCPTECPPNRIYGTQCAQCGPADGCEIVEHACLLVCDGTCAGGACVDSACKTLCG